MRTRRSKNDWPWCVLPSPASDIAQTDSSSRQSAICCSVEPTRTRTYWPTIRSGILANLAVLVRSLACWMALAACRNDMPFPMWSIARLNRMMFLMVTVYEGGSSSSSLTSLRMNNFMALVFSLSFLVAVLAVAPTMSSSSASSLPTTTLSSWKNMSPMIVFTMLALIMNVRMSLLRSIYRCSVFTTLILLSKKCCLSFLAAALYSAHDSACCPS
ncbi:unnamed protein product [Sphagnum troendelagicum]|uniref:NADH dehydrogenase subunit 6 n=1 Tax=Sphagnum troendelagicum TaxID=128251 RepID=A0ABP0TWS4_9BRYO